MHLDTAHGLPLFDGDSAVRYTNREFTILCLIAAGLTNVETAHRLHLSRHTVAQHIAQMLRRTGARSRAGLVGQPHFRV
jgi:DNA-binding CsgD family transcriptional regulator